MILKYNYIILMTVIIKLKGFYMKITRACDYTIRALVYMAQSPMGTAFMRSDIAKACNVPDSFLR